MNLGHKYIAYVFRILELYFWQAVTTLLMAACAAASAIGLVGKFGNSHVGWMAICNDFGRFCDRIIVAVTLSYLAFLVHLLLTVISANKSRGIHVWWNARFDRPAEEGSRRYINIDKNVTDGRTQTSTRWSEYICVWNYPIDRCGLHIYHVGPMCITVVA